VGQYTPAAARPISAKPVVRSPRGPALAEDGPGYTGRVGLSYRTWLGWAAAVFTLAMPALAQAGVPRGFVGMDLDGPIFNKHFHQGRQFDRMVANGVESVRVVFNWAQAQPYPNWNYVPLGQIGSFAPNAVPTDFSATDAIVGQAAQRHLTVLPVVIYTPFWDSVKHPASALGIPRRDGPYANYLRLLIGRYGPHGTFWSSHRNIPEDSNPDVADLERAQRGALLADPAVLCARLRPVAESRPSRHQARRSQSQGGSRRDA
jgi:hypothetical protein